MLTDPATAAELPDSLAAGALACAAGVAISWMIVRPLLFALRSRGAAADSPSIPHWMAESGLLAAILFVAIHVIGASLVMRVLAPPEGSGDAGSRLPLALGVTLGAHVVLLAAVCSDARRRFGARAADFGLAGFAPTALPLATLVLVGSVPALVGAAWLNGVIGQRAGLPEKQMVVQELLGNAGLRGDPFTLLAVVLLLPFCEELLFRGIVLRALRVVFGAPLAIAASSALFALAHDPQSFLPIFVIGTVLALVAVNGRSVFVSVFVHALFNASNVALIWKFGDG